MPNQKGGFLKALSLPALATFALFKGTKKGKSLFNMKGGKRRRKSRTRKRSRKSRSRKRRKSRKSRRKSRKSRSKRRRRRRMKGGVMELEGVIE